MTKILRDGVRRFALLAMLTLLGPGAAASDEPTLLLYGDSLMAGLGLAQEDGFAAQLQAALGDEVAVINASVSGDTAADGLARLDWTLAERPAAVVLALGANDMLQGLDIGAMRSSLGEILDRLNAESIPVLLVGMRASPSLGPDYVRLFEASFPDLAALHGVPLYPFLLEGVALDKALNQADGMHPNKQGVARIVANILPSVRALLNEAGQ